MKKEDIFFIIPIVRASIALAPIGSLASAKQEEENCSVVPKDEDFPSGLRWSIETCSNGEVNYINTDGERCVFNAQANTTRCDGHPPISVQ
jgi:hypothetical protein